MWRDVINRLALFCFRVSCCCIILSSLFISSGSFKPLVLLIESVQRKQKAYSVVYANRGRGTSCVGEGVKVFWVLLTVRVTLLQLRPAQHRDVLGISSHGAWLARLMKEFIYLLWCVRVPHWGSFKAITCWMRSWMEGCGHPQGPKKWTHKQQWKQLEKRTVLIHSKVEGTWQQCLQFCIFCFFWHLHNLQSNHIFPSHSLRPIIGWLEICKLDHGRPVRNCSVWCIIHIPGNWSMGWPPKFGEGAERETFFWWRFVRVIMS